MAHATLLWTLGILTLLTGGAMVWMLVKRRQEAIEQARTAKERIAQLTRLAQRAREAEKREKEAEEREKEAEEREEQQRVELGVIFPTNWRTHRATEDVAEAQLEDEGPAQICPDCGKRYGYGARVCTRDNKELSALN